MADAVHLRLEKIIPEIEEFSKNGLFSQDEIKAIIASRKEYEYKIHRQQPKKADFLSYVAYEMNLGKLIRERSIDRKSGKKKTVPKACYSITNRINYLYQRLLRKFRTDEDLWIQYFDWCEGNKSSRILERGFLQALEFHTKNVNFWTMAADWQFSFNRNPSASRALFQKGLRFNEKSKKLWIKYFRMEVLFAKRIARQNNPKDFGEGPTERVVEKLTVPRIVFKEAVDKIPNDLDFVSEFLSIVIGSKLRSTELIDHILEHLKYGFPDHPKALSMIFCARFRGSDATCGEYPFILKETVKKFRNELNSRLNASLAEYYLDFLLDCAKRFTERNLIEYTKGKIIKHCAFCSEKNICTANMALKSKVFASPELYKLLLHVALKTNEPSVELWLEVIRVSNDERQATLEDLFHRALHSLTGKDDLKRIWGEYFSWKKRNSTDIKHTAECVSNYMDDNEPVDSAMDDDVSSSDSEDEIYENGPTPSLISHPTPGKDFALLHGRFLEFFKAFYGTKVCIDGIIETYVTHCFECYGERVLGRVYSDLISTFKVLNAKFYYVYTELVLSSRSDHSSVESVRRIWLSAISSLESSSLLDYGNAASIWSGLIEFELVHSKSKTRSLEALSRARKNLFPSPTHLLLFENSYARLLERADNSPK